MSFAGLTSKNCLFLICPTDFMEPVLHKYFKGRAFFYAALGACFKWNKANQKNLVKVIQRQNVKQIVFIAKMNNTFFEDKINVKYNLAHYPVEKALQHIEDTLPIPLFFQHYDATIHKNIALIATYLSAQKNRLVDTSHLGQAIKNEHVKVKCMLYNEERGLFHKIETIERKIALFKNMSLN